MTSCVPVTRRVVRMGSAAVGTALLVAACAQQEPVAAPAGGTESSGGQSAAPSQGAVAGPRSLTGGIHDNERTIEVGPAAVTEGVALVDMRLFPTEGERIIGNYFSSFNAPGDFTGGIRMLDLVGAGYCRESGGPFPSVNLVGAADGYLMGRGMVSTGQLVVWPDTGEDEVILDLPGNGKNAMAPRLTGTPVIDA